MDACIVVVDVNCVCVCMFSFIDLSFAVSRFVPNVIEQTSQNKSIPISALFRSIATVAIDHFYFLDLRHFYINRYHSRSQSQFMGIRIQMIRMIAAAAALAEPDELFLLAFAF